MAVGISIPDFDLPRRTPPTRPRLAAGAKSALEHALRISLARADRRIDGRHILLALLRAEAGTVPRALPRRASTARAERRHDGRDRSLRRAGRRTSTAAG